MFTGASAAPPASDVGTYPIHLGDLRPDQLHDQLHDRHDLRRSPGHLVGHRRPGLQDLRRRRPGVHLHLQRVPVLRRRSQLRITGAGYCSRTSGESVLGSPYTITCTPGTLTSPNYSFQTGSTANFAISRRVLSVNADSKTKTYGAADPTFTYGFSGFASVENAGNVTIAGAAKLARLRGDGRRLALHDHGCPRDLVGCQLQLPDGLHGHPRDTKATLSVNADPASKTYGDADPAFTYTFSGFQFSDNAGNSSIHGHRLVLEDPWPVGGRFALHDHLHPRDPDLAQLQLPDRLDRELRDRPPGPVGQRRLQDQDLRGRRPDVHLRLQWVRFG